MRLILGVLGLGRRMWTLDAGMGGGGAGAVSSSTPNNILMLQS